MTFKYTYTLKLSLQSLDKYFVGEK